MSKIKYYDMILGPVITEESSKQIDAHNTYTFKVKKGSNKIEIKKAIEALFKVDVIAVRTINMYPKFKRMGQHEGHKPAYKKAIVKIAEGQTIEAFRI